MAKKPKLSLNLDRADSGLNMKSTIVDAVKNIGSFEEEQKSKNENEPRTYKRVSYTRLQSSPLNDYPIEDIPEMEKLLLTQGLLEPLGVNYHEDEDFYEIESGDRRFHALKNLFSKYESGDVLSEEDERNRALYTQNLHGLYINGIYCMLENGAQDESSKRSRIIIHNESSRTFDPIRTASKLNELSAIYTEQNKSLPSTERVNVNEKIAQELKGKYSVRQIIRYKNFDELIPELKDLVIKYNMSISDLSTYHNLSVEEQQALVEYIKACHNDGMPIELPSKEEIITAVKAAANEVTEENMSYTSLTDYVPDTAPDFLPEDTPEKIPKEPTPEIPKVEEKSSAINDIKAKAAQKIIADKNKKENKIKDTMSALQKKSEQLEKAVYSFIAESDTDTQIDIEQIVRELEDVLSKLTAIKNTISP